MLIKKCKAIGVFAGSFDPIHDGHVDAALSAVEHLGLDELVFMVEREPWSKKQPVDFKKRREMVDLAIEEHSCLYQYSSSTERFDLEKTLTELEHEFSGSDLFFVLGADVFMKMNHQQWPGLDALKKHYIVVFERGDVTESELSNHALKIGMSIAILPSNLPHHASTRVRLKPHDKEVWVCRKVADYIDDHHLYG